MQRQIRQIIVLPEEHGLPPLAILRDMMRYDRNDDAGDASQELSLSAQSPYFNSVLCPWNFR
jgi:hypothetical protein